MHASSSGPPRRVHRISPAVSLPGPLQRMVGERRKQGVPREADKSKMHIRSFPKAEVWHGSVNEREHRRLRPAKAGRPGTSSPS
ncbi:hypothetical protein NITHO_4500003 [Nitrolancea hollandica Lb]|uniref:Uncharacterized protein n=1 Tax=Nitrolancea hollandica Lb TaxID=1129897 RepID=I4EKA8_9BACT|nr:hypothetical protein NITHO_4500003 [Nitrolancea hollandica Lb]